MCRHRFVLSVLVGCVISVTAGCSRLQPYVFKAGEFNRDSPTFAKEPEDIETVTICYNKYGATPEEIHDIAQGRCGAFNRVAHFSRQDRLQCPLLTPVGAQFDCIAPR